MSRRFRAPAYLFAASLAVAVLAGCADDEPSAEPSALSPPTAAASATSTPAVDAFPVTVSNPQGDSTIASEPKRVVAIGIAEADITMALGVTPVAIGDFGSELPWFDEAVTGDAPAAIQLTDSLPIEQVAAFDPDLVITGFGEEGAYAKLAALGPVLWTVESTYSTDWREQARAIGKALGRTERAEQLITETDAKVAAAKADNPGFADTTFTWSAVDPGSINVVDLASAPVNTFMQDLGFAMKPGLADPDSEYFKDVSAENISEIDADVMLLYPRSDQGRAAFEDLPTYGSLTAPKRGAAIYLDDALANALNTPSLLTIPYVLDELLPQLRVAVAAGS